ncbi:hypothetical protein WJX84_007783 [Apatococcus fuscideae]|uniref:Uncharacterized protein n=1 Tax=Apatococcus fuscideae TaxID=2026836 RepID=A0AAW1STH9_9CHLO
MRLRSFAYLKQMEEREPWKDLRLHSSSTVAAHNLRRENMLKPHDRELPMSMSPEAYLASLVPGLAAEAPQPPRPGSPVKLEDDAGQDTSWGPDRRPRTSEPAANGAGGTSGGSQVAPALSPAAAKALPDALFSLFKHNSTNGLPTIRAWLTRPQEQSAAKEAGSAPEQALHSAIVQSPAFTCIRGVYIRASLGDRGLDEFRNLLLRLLRDKESLRKAEIMEAARDHGLSVPDSLYNRIVKDLCQSKGGSWSLRRS